MHMLLLVDTAFGEPLDELFYSQLQPQSCKLMLPE